MEDGSGDLISLFSDLVRLETELWDAVDARLRDDSGLRMGGFDTMRVIAGVPSCRVLDIASELAITVGGASKMVDRIEAAGHCVRRSHPDDRRSSIIELTAAGQELLTAAGVVVGDELARRLGALPAPELARFHTAITTLRAAGARGGDEPGRTASGRRAASGAHDDSDRSGRVRTQQRTTQ